MKGEGWSDAVTSQQKGPPEAGRRKEGLSLRGFRGSVAVLPPALQTSRLQSCERASLCCKPPDWWQLAVAARGHQFVCCFLAWLERCIFNSPELICFEMSVFGEGR